MLVAGSERHGHTIVAAVREVLKSIVTCSTDKAHVVVVVVVVACCAANASRMGLAARPCTANRPAARPCTALLQMRRGPIKDLDTVAVTVIGGRRWMRFSRLAFSLALVQIADEHILIGRVRL